MSLDFNLKFLCHKVTVTSDVTVFQLEIPGGQEAELLASGAPRANQYHLTEQVP